MRNLAIFLLFMSLFAVTLSREIHKRYANQDDEMALLEAFVRAVDQGKIDISNLDQNKRGDLKKRWWWTAPVMPGIGLPGKR